MGVDLCRPSSQLRLLCATAALGCALTIGAGVVARDSESLVLNSEEVQRRAELRAPDVALAASRADTARADIAVAGMFPNPSVTLGTTSGTAVVYGNLFITLPLFGQRATAIDAADAQARVVAAGLEVARLDARLAASVAWVAIWQVDAEISVAADNAARRERLLETARARFDEGAAPRLDVLRAQTEALRARAELTALAQQRQAATARLLVLLGAPIEQPVSLRGEPRLGEGPPLWAILDAKLDEHPLLRRARELLRGADAVITREHRARWPLLGVQVGGSFFERVPPPQHDVSIGVTVALPIFSGPLLARAEMARRAAQVELDAIVAQSRASIAAGRADYAASVSRQQAQVNEVVPAAREAAELSLEAYQSGGLDLTGTLAAEQALSDARLTAARLTADRARAFAALEHAAGRSL